MNNFNLTRQLAKNIDRSNASAARSRTRFRYRIYSFTRTFCPRSIEYQKIIDTAPLAAVLRLTRPKWQQRSLLAVQGSDRLEGGEGNDTYFSKGNRADVIHRKSYLSYVFFSKRYRYDLRASYNSSTSTSPSYCLEILDSSDRLIVLSNILQA